ncbi:hypothetical protein [Solilutibacter silvestris]|nr:hypothetical protein [Lysobacter silvestris]
MAINTQYGYKAARASKFSMFKKTGIDLFLVAAVFCLIGIWYAGPAFFSHFADGIPVSSAGGGVGHMIPGDQYEMYYRHTLPYYNIRNGHSLFYSGYEYNLGQTKTFVDGMIYLPFALLVSMLAFIVGPVAAVNAVIILSFTFCAISGFLLGRALTASRVGGWVCAAIVALLPFRIGFLFGEMFYATDMAFVPLALFFFCKNMQTRKWGYAAAFALTVLALATSNFALLYWFLLFFCPLFFLMTVRLVSQSRGNWRALIPSLLAVALPFSIMGIYLLHVKAVMNESSLKTGQHIEEVRTYSPILSDFLSKWNGNERTIYLGIACLLGIVGWGLCLRQWNQEKDSVVSLMRKYLMLMFPLIYVLAFGTTFGDLTKIHLYEWMFHHVPFANGSRTPGRLMPLVAVSCAPLAGYAVAWFAGKLKDPRVRAIVAVAAISIIAIDFKFSNATMTTLDSNNRAYAVIGNNADSSTVLGIPVQFNADHYLNTTYMYYGLVNNLRMVNGHSSTYPPGWEKFEAIADPLNEGAASREVLHEMTRRGIGYLAVHMTANEPKAMPLVTAMFDRNPALSLLAQDRGIYIYKIKDPSLAPIAIEPGNVAEALAADPEANKATPDVQELSGWYGREEYPNQAPFQWMHGIKSIVLVRTKQGRQPQHLKFSYKCPTGQLTVEGQGISVQQDAKNQEGWTNVVVSVPLGKTTVLGLTAATLYTVATDERKFGCMVREFSIN